jgi:hypothetical protein
METGCPSQTWSKVTGCLAGFAGAAIAFIGIAAAVIQLGAAWAKFGHPGDPSAGDAVGWGLIFLAPILIPIDLAASVVIGMAIYSRLTQRQ